MWTIYSEYYLKSQKGCKLLSEYGRTGANEMFAEAIAEILNGTHREVSKKILDIILGKTNDQ